MATVITNTSRRSGRLSFKYGKLYQGIVVQLLQNVCIGTSPITVTEVEGAKSGPDITITLTGTNQSIGLECKNKGAFEGGSRKMFHNGSRLVFEDNTLHSLILGDRCLYNGENLPYYKGAKTVADYEQVKHLFAQDIYIEAPDTTIADYYNLSGVSYIQIQNKGLYHTGTDILQLGVPMLTCKQRLRIRVSKHINKKGIPTDVVGDFTYDKKTIVKSPYNLERQLPDIMKRAEE